ncbi:MAG TPA: creatininase [Verrucomicrobiota bacterium]|nr:creatininase [Verrucomicrobiota bacterium]
MKPAAVNADDPLGHALLAKRLLAVNGHLADMLAAPPPARRERLGPGRLTATGVGSSEAHARYLVWLLNTFTEHPAEFVPLSAFAAAPGPRATERTLVVFSQGLSQNARLALEPADRFGRLVLFTAATEAGLRRAGHPCRADLLARLVIRGAEIAPFPLEDEYAILIRVVGAACGFLAARQWAAALPGSRLPALRPEDVLVPFLDPPHGDAAILLRSPPLLVPPPLGECGGTLACKFVEGLFVPAPPLVDLLGFAHGAFQQLAAQPRPVLLLAPSQGPFAELARRARQMCARIGAEVTVLPLAGPPDLAPLEAEARLIALLIEAVRRAGVNQREWPGQGLDAPLYAFPDPPPSGWPQVE